MFTFGEWYESFARHSRHTQWRDCEPTSLPCLLVQLHACTYHVYTVFARSDATLDQTPLSISRRSQIVATPPDVLKEVVAALEYYPWLLFE